MKTITSISQLTQNQSNKDLILLDASMVKTASGDTSKHDNQTIPGARYFDLKGSFSDKDSAFPNTMPSATQFELECQKLGINKTSEIVVFDNLGVYSSPRVWWLFKVMGHENVSVLDGGLPAWIEAGNATEIRKSQTLELGNFKAVLSKEHIFKFEDIQKNISNKAFTIIDARSAGRFNGTEPEPRKQLKSGHIEGSINIPFKEVLHNGKYKSATALKSLFEEKCAIENNYVFSCGSGLTACIVLLASEIAFKKSHHIYDGSWTEWAEKNGLNN